VAAQSLIECEAVVLADAQDLPLAGGAFDVAVLEAVSAFCDLERLAGEVWRALEPSGAFTANELTLLAGSLGTMHGSTPSGEAPGRAPGSIWRRRKCADDRCAGDSPITCAERAYSDICLQRAGRRLFNPLEEDLRILADSRLGQDLLGHSSNNRVGAKIAAFCQPRAFYGIMQPKIDEQSRASAGSASAPDDNVEQMAGTRTFDFTVLSVDTKVAGV
jgi:hypothetical protein